MTPNFNLEDRKPIWLALSEFYLDTELSMATFEYIALTIFESLYTFEEVKAIDRHEIFPVLQSNLLNPAGVWDGFDETWLVETITKHLEKRNALTKLLEPCYVIYKHMNESYWQNLEQCYAKLIN